MKWSSCSDLLPENTKTKMEHLLLHSVIKLSHQNFVQSNLIFNEKKNHFSSMAFNKLLGSGNVFALKGEVLPKHSG